MDDALSKASEAHAKACADLTEVARDSVIQSEASRLAMKLLPAGQWESAAHEIERSLRHIHRLTKQGRLG